VESKVSVEKELQVQMNPKPLAPGIFAKINRFDGSIKTVRVLEGQIFVCQGCCCGRPERGNPVVPVEAFKMQWKQRGLRLRVHLTFSACLGPCVAANTVLLIFAGESIWLHSIDTAEQVNLIFEFVEELLSAGVFRPPAGKLAAHIFSRYMSENEAQQCALHRYPSE
jgi:hypothetical protein